MSGNAGVSGAHSSALGGKALGLDGTAFNTAGMENLSVLLF